MFEGSIDDFMCKIACMGECYETLWYCQHEVVSIEEVCNKLLKKNIPLMYMNHMISIKVPLPGHVGDYRPFAIGIYNDIPVEISQSQLRNVFYNDRHFKGYTWMILDAVTRELLCNDYRQEFGISELNMAWVFCAVMNPRDSILKIYVDRMEVLC